MSGLYGLTYAAKDGGLKSTSGTSGSRTGLMLKGLCDRMDFVP
jgi:hypothetical protein